MRKLYFFLLAFTIYIAFFPTTTMAQGCTATKVGGGALDGDAFCNYNDSMDGCTPTALYRCPDDWGVAGQKISWRCSANSGRVCTNVGTCYVGKSCGAATPVSAECNGFPCDGKECLFPSKTNPDGSPTSVGCDNPPCTDPNPTPPPVRNCGYVDCSGCIASSDTKNGTKAGYMAHGNCQIYDVVDDPSAAAQVANTVSFGSGAMIWWRNNNRTHWLAGSGNEDAICSGAPGCNTCPMSGPWVTGNAAMSMDCNWNFTIGSNGSDGIQFVSYNCSSKGGAYRSSPPYSSGQIHRTKCNDPTFIEYTPVVEDKPINWTNSCSYWTHCAYTATSTVGYNDVWECAEWGRCQDCVRWGRCRDCERYYTNGDCRTWGAYYDCCKQKGPAYDCCKKDAPKCTAVQSVRQEKWSWRNVTSCGMKFECKRRLGAVLNRTDTDTSCGEVTKYQVEATCLGTVTQDLGVLLSRDFSPCTCVNGYTFTAKYKMPNRQTAAGDVTYDYFSYNPNTDQCEVKWSKDLAPDGVGGYQNIYGAAGSNGRWVLDAKSNNGWTFNGQTCQFTCTGSDDNAPCYSKVLTAEVRFVPDLRLVVYRDSNFTSSEIPNSDPLNCSTAANSENAGLNNTFNTNVDPKTNRQVVYRINTGGRQLLLNSNIFAAVSYETQFYESLRVSPAGTPALQDLILGEDVNGNSIIGTNYELSAAITNEYDITSDQGYWACACPTIDPNTGVATENDCKLVFNPKNNQDICTSKRIYIGLRACYTSAWWQVSGGNVYAYNDIIDKVPTGVSSNPGCPTKGNCYDVNPPSYAVNDFPQTEPNRNIPGYQSCTPRIIRGRTPCKNDGPSNSAGIALTTNGQVLAADEMDYNFTSSGLTAIQKNNYLRRTTERSNIHALYAGPNYGNNTLNDSGVQAKIANSKVTPPAPPNLSGLGGYTPPKEDYRYLASLAGGNGSVEDIPHTPNNARTTTFTNLQESCIQTDDSRIDTYICYLAGNLTINSADPWYVRAVNGKNQSYTIFVNGNVVINGQAENDNAATIVDIGNFLGFVISGDMTIAPEVGINMPNPRNMTDEELTRCWEGQSATIGGQYPQNDKIKADQISAVGNVEGIFVIDGSLTVEGYAIGSNTSGVCQVDKRFVGQGSFIAWDSVILARDFNPRDTACQGDAYGVYNNRVPAETFIYRPDLVRNTPNWMKRSSVYYQEVTGGVRR